MSELKQIDVRSFAGRNEGNCSDGLPWGRLSCAL